MVRALDPHQSDPGSNTGVDAICGLSLLLVLSLAPGGFSPGTPVFPPPEKPTFPNSNSIWNARTRLNVFSRTLKCFVGKQTTIFILTLADDEFHAGCPNVIFHYNNRSSHSGLHSSGRKNSTYLRYCYSWVPNH